MEMIIILFFFALASVVIVQLYAKTFLIHERAQAKSYGQILKLDSQLKQQAEYQKPTTPGGGGSGSGNTPDPKPNPDEGDEEAPDPTV